MIENIQLFASGFKLSGSKGSAIAVILVATKMKTQRLAGTREVSVEEK